MESGNVSLIMPSCSVKERIVNKLAPGYVLKLKAMAIRGIHSPMPRLKIIIWWVMPELWNVKGHFNADAKNALLDVKFWPPVCHFFVFVFVTLVLNFRQIWDQNLTKPQQLKHQCWAFLDFSLRHFKVKLEILDFQHVPQEMHSYLLTFRQKCIFAYSMLAFCSSSEFFNRFDQINYKSRKSLFDIWFSLIQVGNRFLILLMLCKAYLTSYKILTYLIVPYKFWK